MRNTGKHAWFFLLFLYVLRAGAQFKEVGPAPFSPAVAHQKIKQLLVSVNSANRKPTVATLSDWVSWYRDILDEELIAAWRRDSRANLPEVIEVLANERVASGIVTFSWRENRPATFQLPYVPMLTSLMSRYPKSSEPVLQDLLRQAPALSPGEAEAVCRILVDMPDVGAWRDTASRILPHYAEAAKSLLTQDLHSGDEDKMYRAEMWMTELKMNSPAATPRQESRQRVAPYSPPDSIAEQPRRLHVDGPPVPLETERRPARVALPIAPVPQATLVYDGPRSGIYESTGSPIPQSAEYVFRNVPLVPMRLDYDSKIWEAHLVPGEGKTQRLIVKNKSSSPQKRCVVRWTAIQ